VSPSQNAAPTHRRWSSAALSDSSGLTLVELLVAMLLLGIVLSATASSLIQFGRTAADNERRVQATALMNRLHEEMQSVPWRDAGNYVDELDDLHDDGFPGLSDSPNWTIDGEEIVTILAPVAERSDTVPELTTRETVDDRDFDVVRFVTWSDQAAGIKRFTTIVRWELYNRVYEERFVSERAATSAEAGDPELPRVVQFQMGPSPMRLTAVDAARPAQNEKNIDIIVRFSEGVDDAELAYQPVSVTFEDDLPVYALAPEKTLTLDRYISEPGTGRGLAFRGTIAAEAETFPNGTRPFIVRGTVGALTATGRTSMVFENGTIKPEDIGEPADDTNDDDADGDTPISSVPLAVNSVTLSRTNVCQRQNNDQFRSEVVVSASIQGLLPQDHVVTIAYTAGGSPRSETMTPVAPDTFSDTGATFTTTFAEGVDHLFRPTGNSAGDRDETSFTVTARRSGDAPAERTSSQELAVRYGSGGSC
jgi:prepilin-type N-terminal cleavage/methylation domain-containing protein